MPYLREFVVLPVVGLKNVLNLHALDHWPGIHVCRISSRERECIAVFTWCGSMSSLSRDFASDGIMSSSGVHFMWFLIQSLRYAMNFLRPPR